MTAPSFERWTNLSTKLSQRSVVRYTNPHTRFEWPDRAPPDRLAMSPGLSMLAGHPLLAELSDEQRWRLHLQEAVHFFSLNIAGERELLTGLVQRLYKGACATVAEYMHHFVHEENAHSVVFSRFCMSYGGVVYPDPQIRFGRDPHPGEEDILFFARVLAFEQIADSYNRRLAGDDALWPLVRGINRYHAEDEARHIAFGKAALVALWERYALAWPEEVRDRVRAHLRAFIDATLRSYVSAAVLRDAGVPGDPYALRREILALPERAALGREATRRTCDFLSRLGALAPC
ncbi:diiron oxygenase [Pendulispora albinea]|uniref:Diiron oxygenase n=1 Tax=Pendulispora albinea TaxID=2741071 RepID=A0ABZ2LWJ8_9BACT